ncbi:MAG: hypothetical protein IPG06_11565 [Haliea sp.]|nr:hypothetical protein [Haliea sp.]
MMSPWASTRFQTLRNRPSSPPSQAQQQLAGKANAMQRSGRYQILFHEVWTQPMYSEAESVPIVLDRSGDGGAWPALQGSIKLYLASYIYLETNLWLNTQGEYLPGSWRMPAPPLAPRSNAPAGALPAPAQPVGQPAVTGTQTPVMNSPGATREIGAGESPRPWNKRAARQTCYPSLKRVGDSSAVRSTIA